MSNVRAAKRRMQTERTYGQNMGTTVEDWRKTFCILPRRTVSGELRLGPLYRRATHSFYFDYMGYGPQSVEYATEKDMFKRKLLGI